jgi:hypothetical protein
VHIKDSSEDSKESDLYVDAKMILKLILREQFEREWILCIAQKREERNGAWR